MNTKNLELAALRRLGRARPTVKGHLSPSPEGCLPQTSKERDLKPPAALHCPECTCQEANKQGTFQTCPNYITLFIYRTGAPGSAVLPGVPPYFFSIHHCFCSLCAFPCLGHLTYLKKTIILRLLDCRHGFGKVLKSLFFFVFWCCV